MNIWSEECDGSFMEIILCGSMVEKLLCYWTVMWREVLRLILINRFYSSMKCFLAFLNQKHTKKHSLTSLMPPFSLKFLIFLRAHLLAPSKSKESRFYLNFILVRLFNCLQIHWTQKERHHITSHTINCHFS